ncbi:MAG: CDP-alcohol phosphatidyltransferase family protein [Gaiellaceae bacterium]
MNRAETIRQGYLAGVRRFATHSMTGLARTRVTPNVLTASGVSLCIGASVLVGFESRNELLFYWLGAAVFVFGSVLDILDGALARASARASQFGAYLDSTTDRIGEAFVLGAAALVFSRAGDTALVGLAVAAIVGSLLVSYARAKAEALGLRGDVGFGDRATRVVVITAGLVLAPWGVLPYAIGLLTALAWYTVLRRILFVRSQLLSGGK